MSKLISLIAVAVCLFSSFPATAALTSGTPVSLASDNHEDIEPALISQVRSSGLTHNISVYMKFHLQAWLANSTLVSSVAKSNGTISVSNIPATSGGYDRYADPVLAKYDAGTNQPVYLTGVAKDDDNPNDFTDRTKTAVPFWASTDGGVTWAARTTVALELGRDPFGSPTAEYFLLDKPAIAVSSNGTIYVAYVRLNGDSPYAQIMISSSTDGGWNWSTPVQVAAATRPHPETGNAVPSHNQAPQVMVDSNGDVYVMWAVWADDAGAGIYGRVARASSPLSFTEALPTIGTGAGSLYGSPGRPDRVPFRTTGTVTEFVRAATVPTAKLDSATGRRRIAVTWHQHNDATTSNIRFAALPLSTTSYSGASWSTTTFTRAGTFNLQPGMDFDANGNFLVAYYAFGGDDTYWQYGNYVTFSGNTPVVGTNTALSNVISDIDAYQSMSFAPNEDDTIRLLGEYHDVSYSAGSFKMVGIVCVTTGNPWLWTITNQ